MLEGVTRHQFLTFHSFCTLSPLQAVINFLEQITEIAAQSNFIKI